MNVNAGQVRQCLRDFDFKNLFIQELNWSHCSNRPIDLELDGNIARLSPFAELGGVVVYQVELHFAVRSRIKSSKLLMST